MRFCSSSWLARKSASSSALATGEPAKNAIATVSPPVATALPRFRRLIIRSSLFIGCELPGEALFILSSEYGTGGSDQVRFFA
jgi:hypothetical protein